MREGNRIFKLIRAKVREGLEEARRGEFIDGEAFFAAWKKRIKAAAAQKYSRGKRNR